MIRDIKVTRGKKILDAQNRKKKRQGTERRKGMEKRVKAMKWKVRGRKREAIASLKALILRSFVRWETSLCCVFKHENYYRHLENILIAVSDFVLGIHIAENDTDFFFFFFQNNKAWRANAWGVFILLHRTTSHIHTLTFKRQALVTTCLGSTTSTRGSLMATLRMQLMSKPYTFSHPERTHTKKHLKWSTHMKTRASQYAFCGFLLSEFSFSVLSAPAKLSVWPKKTKKKTGRRESTTSA